MSNSSSPIIVDEPFNCMMIVGQFRTELPSAFTCDLGKPNPIISFHTRLNSFSIALFRSVVGTKKK